MSILSYSQGTYPRKIVLGTDIVIAITTEQMQTINSMYLSLQECRDIQVPLLFAMDSCQILSALHDSTIQTLYTELFLQSVAIEDRDKVIGVAQDVTKAQERHIKRLMTGNSLWRGATLLSIITIGVLIFL